jgi:N-acetylglucosaminyldiphosphoundecaprenol N-acetyl-beta-D-mannosaminyltransferase
MSADGRVRVLGLPVDSLDLPGLLDAVEGFITRGAPVTVSYLNVHVANIAADDPELTRFLQTIALCYCDGSGVVLGARLLGESLPARMTGADWIWSLAARAEGRWRVAWIGGAPGVTERAAAALRERHPGLEIQGWHGFTPEPETQTLIDAVNAYAPQIVLVGMGTPTQERWAARWRPSLHAPVLWCLGATADFVSGEVSRGPAFLYEHNLEWLARLVTEPRRLWRRYLVGNPRFLGRVLLERARR